MQESCKRMADLTTDILDFARGKLGGGGPLRSVDDPNLGAILSQVIEELATVHPERSIDVQLDVGESVNLLLRAFGAALNPTCSPTRLMLTGPTIVRLALSFRMMRTTLSIEVSNAGNPIPERRLGRLFQPFERDPTPARTVSASASTLRPRSPRPTAGR